MSVIATDFAGPAGYELPASVEISRLSNGLLVVTDRMDHLESASLGVWVRAGSRDETDAEHGLSHMLEHMAFKGTGSRSAQEIAEAIENVGGDLNAATSSETTAFYARVLQSDVPLALELLSDILVDPNFDEGELEREKHVILQEIGAAKDNPEDQCFDQYQESAFSGQALGRQIMGTPETVSGFSTDGLKAYLAERYHGSNMVLSASGAVSHDAIVKQAEGLFGGLPASPVSQPHAARYTGGDARTAKPLQEAQFVLGFEGRAYQARDYYASQVLATLLGGGMSSRLFQELRERRGLCYSIYAFHWAFSDTGTFGIHAATEEGDLLELAEVVAAELIGCIDSISVQELDRARAQIRAGLLMAMETPSARAGLLARQQLLFGRPITTQELMDRLSALTPQRLRDLASNIFTTSPPTISAIGPIASLPSMDDMRERLGQRLS